MKLLMLVLLPALFQCGLALDCWSCVRMDMDFSATNLSLVQMQAIAGSLPIQSIDECPDESMSSAFARSECDGQCVTFAANGSITMAMGVGNAMVTIPTISFTRECAVTNTIPTSLMSNCSTTDVQAMYNFSVASAGLLAAFVTITLDSGDICFCTESYCNGPAYVPTTTVKSDSGVGTINVPIVTVLVTWYLLLVIVTRR